MAPTAPTIPLPLRVPDASDLRPFVGRWFGPIQGPALTQDMVDRFCALAGDRQWIHTDPVRAAGELPGGRTIVPGNLLLACVPSLLQQIYIVEGAQRAVLAGYTRVRFRAPVPTGARIAMDATFVSVRSGRDFVRIETECRIGIVESDFIALTAMVTDLFTLQAGSS